MNIARVGNKLNVPFGTGGNLVVQVDVPLTTSDSGSKSEYAEASKWADYAAAALMNNAVANGVPYNMTQSDLATLLLHAVLKG
jgi:hypothetical protein